VVGHFVGVAAGVINGDGIPDFVALRDDGSVVRIADRGTSELVQASGSRLTPATANLILADFDNNGSLDVLAGDGHLYLGSRQGFTPISIPQGITFTSAVDLANNGRVDPIGSAGKAVELVSHGSKKYHWQTLRLRAAKATGDQRINSFGIGGEVEIRSGLLTQKQIITSPVLHFGLGEHTGVDVTRIVWPNGSVQAEFELKPDQSVLAEQRLKGSCPLLFAWDGKQISFVKDGEPWSPALGLHWGCTSMRKLSRASTRLRNGSRCPAKNWLRATVITICELPRNFGRLITSTITRFLWLTIPRIPRSLPMSALRSPHRR
jgi:hypothetical protein